MTDDRRKTIITRRGLAVSALPRWRERFRGYMRGTAASTEMALAELGENPDPNAVDAVFGSNFTREECSVCGESGEGPWVGLGWDPDYDCPDVTVCVGCLRSAVAMIDEKEAK